MSSPCTMNKLIRWRVRDWASCFVACRCSLGEEEADKLRSSSPELAARKLVFDVEDDKENMQEMGGNIMKRIKEKEKTKNKKKKRASAPNHQGGSGKRVSAVPLMEGEGDESGSSCPCHHHHQHEDFIVFSFKEGGQFDIVDDHEDTVEAMGCCLDDPPNCHVDIKEICCVKVTEKGSESNSGDLEREGECGVDVGPNVKGDEGLEEGGDNLEAKSPPSTPPRSQQAEEQDCENSGVVSAGSNGSNKSDGSTGSFSFPVLPWELLGSPVEMPRVGSFQMRKNKAARFQCCRF